MTLYGPVDTFLLVSGKDLTSDTYTLDNTQEEIIEETHPYGKGWEESKGVGVAKATLEAGGGLYDDRQVGMLAALQEQNGVSQLIAYGVKGLAIGARVTQLAGALVTTWKRVAARDGITKGNALYVVSGRVREGVILFNHVTPITADGNSEASSVDNLASSADGAVADLHVPDLTLDGHTGLLVRVLKSTDNISFSLAGAFTTKTLAGTSERITIAGTIPRYLAIDYDFEGPGSSPSVPSASIFVAIHRN